KKRSARSLQSDFTPALALSPGTAIANTYQPGRATVATGVVYVPGPFAVNVPCQTLVPHLASVSDGNGPSIETETVPRQPVVAPLIVTLSRTTWPTTNCVGDAAEVTAMWPLAT